MFCSLLEWIKLLVLEFYVLVADAWIYLKIIPGSKKFHVVSILFLVLPSQNNLSRHSCVSSSAYEMWKDSSRTQWKTLRNVASDDIRWLYIYHCNRSHCLVGFVLDFFVWGEFKCFHWIYKQLCLKMITPVITQKWWWEKCL